MPWWLVRYSSGLLSVNYQTIIGNPDEWRVFSHSRACAFKEFWRKYLRMSGWSAINICLSKWCIAWDCARALRFCLTFFQNFPRVGNCNTARYVGWHGTPNRSTRHAWLRNEARCVGWWGTLWPLLCLSACVLTKLNIAITLFIFFRLVDREESSNFAPEIIKMK